METTLANAFSLLLIGMSTVFIILSFITISGRILIGLVNRFAPKPVKEEMGEISAHTKKIAEAAIHKITHGKGKIQKITKID